MHRLSISRQIDDPMSYDTQKDAGRRIPKSDRSQNLESSVSRMLKPLPWKLSEEQTRHDYEAQGSRFVKTLAARAREEAAIADQYSKLLNIEKSGDRKPEQSKNAAYLDDVKEDNWPSRRQETVVLPTRKKPSRPILAARKNPDFDRLLHPWQREIKALANNSAAVGNLPPLAKMGSSGRARQIVNKKKDLGRSGAPFTTPPVVALDVIENDGSLDDGSSIGEEDGSSIGWSPFIVPS